MDYNKVSENLPEQTNPYELTPDEYTKKQDVYEVNYKHGVNVRSSPSTESFKNILTVIPQGEYVFMHASPKDNHQKLIEENPEWCIVEIDDSEEWGKRTTAAYGFVKKEFLTKVVDENG